MSLYQDELPQKRKCIPNAKLISEDNVHEDAVKRRKLIAQPLSTQPTAKPIPHRSRSASVAAVDDEDDLSRRNAGRPRDPNTIIESIYDDETDKPAERLRSKGSASTKGKGAAKPHGTNSKSGQQHRRSASVEVVDDEDDISRRNAGRPRDPNTIIESVYDDETETPASKKGVATSRKPSRKAVAEVVEEEDGLQEDADEAELR
jgi:ribosomal protein L35